MSGLADLSLAELSRELRARRVTSIEATEACLQRIAERDELLNSFRTLCADEARAEAAERDRELADGRWRGPLHGVPLGLKDLLQTAGIRTTAGSALLRDWVPDADATVVRRLRNAGAVSLGKLNMYEFAFGATSDNPHYGPVRNPHDPARGTGGSSSGSGAAVAAGLCYGSVGSDTGGSIRCPAALCGIVGLKPTYGRVSRHGAVPLAWSLDHLGPMARTVTDAALLLEALAGHDPADPTSSTRPVPPYAARLEGGVRGLRVGIPRELFWSWCHSEVELRVREAIELLRREGAEIREVSLPSLDYAATVQGCLILAEAAAYHREWLATRSGDYGSRVRMRLAEGLCVEAADYLNALQARQLLRDDFSRVFQEVDALLTPAVPIPAPRLDQEYVAVHDGVAPAQFYMVRNTFVFNMTGTPAVSVPCGAAEGMPVGLQIAGRAWEEETVLRIARAWERVFRGE
ncbi:MAG: amidase [Armatimonadota bacterium]